MCGDDIFHHINVSEKLERINTLFIVFTLLHFIFETYKEIHHIMHYYKDTKN